MNMSKFLDYNTFNLIDDATECKLSTWHCKNMVLSLTYLLIGINSPDNWLSSLQTRFLGHLFISKIPSLCKVLGAQIADFQAKNLTYKTR